VSANHVAAGRAVHGLDRDTVLQIRQGFAEGERVNYLCFRWGLSRTTINRVVYGRTYRDYGGPIREPRS
jgi:hypothetical protein